ncbi:MAG: DUF350 domain-containing protein [Proteobacteria bacterium]|nr:DUF350 domain-containing protein [Pseudomonadota bacterium]
MNRLTTLAVLCLAAAPARALEGAAWRPDTFPMAVASTCVFGLMGILLSIAGFKLFDKVSPFDIEREICEKQNMAVGLLCAGMMIGICIVVAAAVL